MRKLLVIVVIALSACATPEGQPPYWLKKYEGAPPEKTAACLARARAAYNATPIQLDPGFARVNMGDAWEACMGK